MFKLDENDEYVIRVNEWIRQRDLKKAELAQKRQANRKPTSWLGKSLEEIKILEEERQAKKKKLAQYRKNYYKDYKKNPISVLRAKLRRYLKYDGPWGTSPLDAKDIINKFGNEPKCYITGLPIDYSDPSTYSFDHIIPRSKGGPNTLENLGLCHPTINIMKNTMSIDELKEWCKLILNPKV